MVTIIRIQAVLTQGRFNNHTSCSLYKIMDPTINEVGVMKMGEIVLRVGIEPKSLAFWASILTFTTPRPCDMRQCHSVE